MIYKSNSLEETKIIAQKIAKGLKKGTTILLRGDLGAGKTTFTGFLCEALGVEDVVSSPSFTIVKEYYAKDFKIYHIDLYRLSSEEELIEIGFDEIINDESSVKIIEWPDIAIDYITGKVLSINILYSNFGRSFDINEVEV